MSFASHQAASIDATSLGVVLTVRGSEAHVGLSRHIDRAGGGRPTVGRFLAIDTGSCSIVGMIAEISSRGSHDRRDGDFVAVARIELMGEIMPTAGGDSIFRRGVHEYPVIGEPVRMISGRDLRLIYTLAGKSAISIGCLHQDPSVPAYVDIDNLLTKHFAVLGSTGVGKSSGVAVILAEAVKARPQLRVLVLDAHNEYGNCFSGRSNILGPRNLKLPFWLFNFEEFTDIIYGGRQAVAEEIEILAELIPIAKLSYQQVQAKAT